ncbi:MAG TPA: hypothetical protein RMH99_03430 [Sandaracinaceae bacterium LLY-WYZ-13_1]|nr:hypothetical protein [Sandaracinaceae bacterium LLY-WYZ-13_1]
MSVRLATAALLAALAGAAGTVHAQQCPAGFVADGDRCLQRGETPVRWQARSNVELYTLDRDEDLCLAPLGGSCAVESGHPLALGSGIGLAVLGYGAAGFTTWLTWQGDGIAPYDEDAAYNLIPVVGPMVALGVALDTVRGGDNALGQLLFGTVATAMQIAGVALIVLGLVGSRRVVRDADGRTIELTDGIRLAPDGLVVAF